MRAHNLRSATPNTWRGMWACALACSAALVPVAQAQDAPPSGWSRANDSNGASSAAIVPWFGAWSPLRPSIDIPRGLLRAPLSAGILDGPAPRTGAFIIAGAPGAIVHDLRTWLPGDSARFSELRVRRSQESGDYKRPLDVGDATVTQAIGQGWSPVGKRGIAVGRFVLDRETHDAAGFSQRVAPYWSSPFIITDSVTPPTQRTRARLEGALGFDVGGFGLGVAAGLESREHNTFNVPLRRSGRASTPGIVAGVERELPWFSARIGTFYKWTEANETNVLNAVPLPTIMYRLQGYEEPFGFLVTESSPVFVRNDRRSVLTGGTVEFTVASTRVVAVYEQGDRTEDQYQNFVSGNRPTDRWRASGSTAHVQLSRGFGDAVRATIVGVRETLTGTASRADLTGIAFDGEDTNVAFEGDVRATFGVWTTALNGGMTQRRYARYDYVVERRTALDIGTPFVGAEVSRPFGRTAVAIGGSFASRSATGGIPATPDEPTYRRLLQPELAYEAAESSARAGWFSVRAPVGSQMMVLTARMEVTSPQSLAAARLQPEGERTVWSVGLGWQR